MRIGINALYLIPGKVGGTEFYLRNLLHWLVGIDDKNQYYIFSNTENHGTWGIDRPNFYDVLCPFRATTRPVRVVAEQLILPFLVKRNKIDVLHSPGYTGPIFVSCPAVVTIHDMQTWHYPDLGETWRVLFWKTVIPLVARRSTSIITVSHSAKSDIQRFLGVPPEKVEVIYEASRFFLSMDKDQPNNDKEVLRSIGLSGPFILTVGTLFPHKNYERLLEAYSLLSKEVALPLVCAGLEGNQLEKLRRQVEELRIPDSKVIFPGFVDERVLSVLYRNAVLFVMPSFFEGFGLPVLEAMALGCPVCCSNATSLPEVAGEAAVYFNPFDVKEMAEALTRVLQDEELRSSLVRKGFEQARRFSWKRAAIETLAVYEKAARRQRLPQGTST